MFALRRVLTGRAALRTPPAARAAARFASDTPSYDHRGVDPKGNFPFPELGYGLLSLGTLILFGSIYYDNMFYKARPFAVRAMFREPNPALKGEFASFEVRAVKDLTPDTKSIEFALPREATELGLPTASYVLVRVPGGEKPVVRPYTPVEYREKPDSFTLIVKKYPAGQAGTYLHALKRGDRVEMKGPMRKTDVGPTAHEHIGMIAGGSGITPMLQVAHRLLHHPESRTQIDLVFGNQTPVDVMCRKELDDLQRRFGSRFRVTYLVDRPVDGWTGGVGYVTKELLKDRMPAPGAGKIFVCGPVPMLQAVAGGKTPKFEQGELKGLLKDLGYSEQDVFKF